MSQATAFQITGLLGLLLLSVSHSQHEEGANLQPGLAQAGEHPAGHVPENDRAPYPVSPEGEDVPRYELEGPRPGVPKFGLEPLHDDGLFYTLRADRLEYRSFDGGEALLWDVQGWIGRDYNKLFLESEGEWVNQDEIESAQFELLYGRAISSFWDVRGGVRYDLEPQPERAFAVLGVQGLAPQWFEIDANLYVSEDADVFFILEAEYDILLSQRLVLQPRLEVEVSAQDVSEYETGQGFTGVEMGLRLRYEISRKFAPYIGVSWESALGETRSIIRSHGGDPDTTSLVSGVRFWF